MKLCVLLISALAISLGAQTPQSPGKTAAPASRQAASDQRIPIQKTRFVPVDTVVLQRVDTVTLLRVDTVYVTTAAPSVLGVLDTLLKTDTLKCTNKVFPVPIPIPIPVGGTDHPGGLGVASTAPEPATAWLVGVGLVALGFTWGRRQRGSTE
jgi:hypothetical protein